MTYNMEKTKVVSAIVTFFTGKTSLQESQVPMTRGKVQGKEGSPWAEKDQVKEHSNGPDLYKFQQDTPRGTVGACQCHCEATLTGRKQVLLLSLRRREKDLGNYKLVSHTSIPGEGDGANYPANHFQMC